MKTHLILVGIAILLSALYVPAADVPETISHPSHANVSVLQSIMTSSDYPTIRQDTLTLQEVTVQASFSPLSHSPLRLKTIDEQELRSRAAARTYPELMKGIPGLYATSESGSYGDAKLNIRGFRQENIAVLLNGIPISGLTSGNMFWNNWMGLSDATYAIQVQKGVGSSMLSDGSVGGSINIITDAGSERPGVNAGVYGSHYGTVKGYVSVSSGRLSGGWGVNLMASYVGGQGYVDATSVSAFSYMLNVSKRINEDHSILFTALGSPEQHDQRSTRLSAGEMEKYGRTYNKNWGWRDGKPFNLSRNNYFKPYFTLQHIWNGEKLSMKNSLYLAIGDGGGRWSECFSGKGISGRPIASYLKDGQVDWEAVADANLTWDGAGGFEGSPEGVMAQNVLSDYMAGHTQAGAITSADFTLDDRWTLGAGLHYQYYSTWECERITDLLGADYWYEDYENKSLAGLAGRDPYKQVGDYVRTDNGKITHHGTAYLTASYDAGSLNANLGVSVFGSLNRRWDRYNYTGADVYSDLVGGVGASVKGGVLYKPSDKHSIYMNGGWYSRLPYPSVWFSSGNNEITKGVRNEQNLLGELGYRYVWNSGGVEITGYAALWKDKAMMSDKYKQADAIGDTKYMVTGLDAFHYGAEADVFYRPVDRIKLSAFASVGDRRWQNDVRAIIYDSYTDMEIGRVNVYSDGLPVGDAPQTQLGAAVEVTLPYGFRIEADWQFNDRMYADFDPVTRTEPSDRLPSYRIPSYHLLGATFSWTHRFGERSRPELTLYATGANLTDTEYIERGKDGSSHDRETFRGYWGFGRTFSFGLRLSF